MREPAIFHKELFFEDFVSCFRKQFQFQVGHGGRRISRYYARQTWERGLKNDQWAIMVFIYTGTLYGFPDDKLMAEVKIRESLYFFLKEEVDSVIQSNYPDQLLHRNVVCKIGLVKNAVSLHKKGFFT